MRDLQAFRALHGELPAADLAGQKSHLSYEADARVLYLLQDADSSE